MKEQSPERYISSEDLEILILQLDKDSKFKVIKRGSNEDIEMYWQSEEMAKSYAIYRDIVWVNRRMQRTRFSGRNLVMFCGVDSEGRTIVFGVSLLKDDSQDSYKFAIDSFLASHSPQLPPQTLLLERVS